MTGPTAPSAGHGAVLVEAGRRAWAVAGIVLVAVLLSLALSRISVVVIALLIALFPAALLAPGVSWLRSRGAPSGLAAAAVVLTLLGGLAATLGLIVPVVVAEAPALSAAATRGLERVEDALRDASLPVEIEGIGQLLERGFDAVGGGELAGRGFAAATTLVQFATGLAVMLIALFFYLRDGRRLWSALTDLVPARYEPAAQEIGERVWWTLGAYFRGQLLVALFDAVLIGLGLFLLGVPLALPLSVLVFFGGLFPIVGAFVTGLLAVLVAFADSGLTTAGLVLALVVVVQQVEGNLLQPLILSKVIALHPLVVITVVTAGALAYGVLGAFLAVPIAASVARTLDYVRGRTPETGPGAGTGADDEDDAAKADAA
jgi:predicted PurR-regulated permease PerM